MTYTRDPNQIAAEHARREEREFRDDPVRLRPQPVMRGTLTIWHSLQAMMHDQAPLAKSLNAVLDVSKPGLVIAYGPDGDAEIFAIQPGWYIFFEPNREGE